MEKKRSRGVVFFGVISEFYGGLLLLVGYSGDVYRQFNPDKLSLIRTVVAVGFIVSGLFLLRLKNWARICFLTLMGLNMIAGLYRIYFGGILTVISSPGEDSLSAYFSNFAVFSIVPFIITLYFFTRPKVKEQFQ